MNFDKTEDALSAARANQQDKRCPLLIRDDGMLMPNTPKLRMKPRMLPYHGPRNASLDERLQYIANFGKTQRRQVVYQPSEPFDLGKASAEEILAFAADEYGAVLDPETPLNKLREQCYMLSTVPDDMRAEHLAKMVAQRDERYDAADLGVPSIGDITAPPKPAAERVPRASGGRGRRGAIAES